MKERVKRESNGGRSEGKKRGREGGGGERDKSIIAHSISFMYILILSK